VAAGGVSVYIGTRELTELVDFVVEDREDRLADRITTGKKGRSAWSRHCPPSPT
jgi:hypothetical protein